MKDSSIKFNLYDQLGYILVGLYQIILGYLLFLFINASSLDISKLAQFDLSILIVLFSYFIGQIAQAVSNFVEDVIVARIIKKVFKCARNEADKKNEKNNSLGFITEDAKKFFGLPKNLGQKYIFQYCYLFALSNDFSGHIVLFNSMYSLYRGFFTSSIIGLVFYLGALLYSWVFGVGQPIKTDPLFYLTIFALVLLTWLFFNRKERFFKYMGEKTLITFDILSKGKIGDKK